MVYVFLANGFEEMEALSPVDILRRAKIEVKTVGIGSKTVMGSHNIPVVCDITEDEVSFDNLEGIILPGGMPGTLNLEKNKTVNEFIDYSQRNGLIIGAICAAPSILGHKGLLKGKKATCFNGFEKELEGAVIVEKPAVTDKNIVTGWGAGGAFDFAFAYLTALTNDSENTEKLRLSVRYN